LDEKGKEKIHVFGNWNSKISFKILSTGEEFVVWQVTPKHAASEKQYGFNKFICNLNYVDEDMKQVLPPTDTRLRPDQRFWENFQIEPAAEHKERLENKQRAKRKDLEKRGIAYEPLWFKEDTDGQGHKYY
jgi:hypothetical protein